MTHIVSDGVVGVPAQPVVTRSNVKFEIQGMQVLFCETPEPLNNVDVFETFDLARSAAVQAFAQYKADVLAAIAQTENELLTIQGPSRLAVNPVTPAVTTDGVVPRVVANSPAVGTTHIV